MGLVFTSNLRHLTHVQCEYLVLGAKMTSRFRLRTFLFLLATRNRHVCPVSCPTRTLSFSGQIYCSSCVNQGCNDSRNFCLGSTFFKDIGCLVETEICLALCNGTNNLSLALRDRICSVCGHNAIDAVSGAFTTAGDWRLLPGRQGLRHGAWSCA